MAKKLKTPGQKRKTILRIIVLFLAIVVIGLGAVVKGGIAVSAKRLIAEHETVAAEITDVKHETVKYRKKKKTRTKDVYSVSYGFQVNGQNYSNTLMISDDEYKMLKDEKQLEVWHAPGDPDRNSTEAKLRSQVAQGSFLGNAFGVGVFVLPAAIVLYSILAFFFAKEPKGVVPEGFVTENSWLDVDDNYLIMIENEDLVVVNINEKRISRVQDLYQESAPLETIVAEGKGKVERVPLAEITSIESKHSSDTFYVTYGEDEKSSNIEFLNPTVKEHALERIAPKLPSVLTKSVKKLGRLRAAMPSLIGGGICGGAMAYFNDALFVLLLGGLGLIYAVKILFKRLLDPTVITVWTIVENNRTKAES